MGYFIKSGYWEKLAKGFSGYLNLDLFTLDRIDNSKYNTIIESIQFIFSDAAKDNVYHIVTKARSTLKLNKLAILTNTGTATIIIKINDVALQTINVTATVNDVEISDNIVEIGDKITLTISALTDATSLIGNLETERL